MFAPLYAVPVHTHSRGVVPLQVTGFFVLESFVLRVTEGLLGPQEAAQVSARHCCSQ
jgi:hypothetical protein